MMQYIYLWGAGGTDIATVSAMTQVFLSQLYLRKGISVIVHFCDKKNDYPKEVERIIKRVRLEKIERVRPVWI
jgi:hypothetical protein